MSEEGSKPTDGDHTSMFDENSLQCPFTWRPQTEVESTKIINKIERKIVDAESEEGETVPWTKFILNMILCYEYSNLGQVDRASEKEKECENIVNDSEMTNNYIRSAKEAFKHVNLSSKFFLLKQNRLKKESADVLRDIILMSKMNNKEKATVWSIGSAVFMEYGPRNSEISVLFVKKALQLDPHCAEWSFLLGKVLGRIRREKKGPKGIPEDDEIKALQLAVEKSRDPMYKVILAQTYMEVCRAKYFLGKFKNTDNEMLKKSSLLYRQASKDGDNNPFVLRKCAEGFNKLPGSLKNLQLSKECIVRALEIAPNIGIFHAAGLIFQKENSNLAKQYFMRAIEGGSPASCFYLLKIKHEENKSYNPCADIERYLSLFTGDRDKSLFFCWLGAYYYFVKDDFDAALEFWKKLFVFSDTSFVLTDSYCPWDIGKVSFNMSDIIWKEITERIRCDANQQTKYESILQDLKRLREKNQENRT